MEADERIEAPGSTRERLLEAAARLFSEHGRDAVSIRDIAAEAGVRHGNINYHFRTKDELYREVLLRFCVPGGRSGLRGLPDELAPDEARALFARIVREIVAEEVSPSNRIATGLVRGEMAREDGVDEQLFAQVIQPHQRAMAALLGHMFPHLGERERVIAAFNVASQCIFLRMARPVALRLFGVDDFGEDLIEEIADRIITTALHGLGTSRGAAS